MTACRPEAWAFLSFVHALEDGRVAPVKLGCFQTRAPDEAVARDVGNP